MCALHHFFVQQYGWYVNEFVPGAELWNAPTATEMLKEKVSSHVQELVKKEIYMDANHKSKSSLSLQQLPLW